MYRRFLEAIVQSAALYSTASIALVITTFLSPNIGYVICLSVFPQLVVSIFLMDEFSGVVLMRARDGIFDLVGRSPFARLDTRCARVCVTCALR